MDWIKPSLNNVIDFHLVKLLKKWDLGYQYWSPKWSYKYDIEPPPYTLSNVLIKHVWWFSISHYWLHNTKRWGFIIKLSIACNVLLKVWVMRIPGCFCFFFLKIHLLLCILFIVFSKLVSVVFDTLQRRNHWITFTLGDSLTPNLTSLFFIMGEKLELFTPYFICRILMTVVKDIKKPNHHGWHLVN